MEEKYLKPMKKRQAKNRLKQIMFAKGISFEEISVKTSIPIEYLKLYANNEMLLINSQFDIVHRIACALGLSQLSELFEFD